MEVIKNNQIEILEWKSTIIEINLLERLSIRFEISRKKNEQTWMKEVNWDYPIWEITEPQNTWAARIEGGEQKIQI